MATRKKTPDILTTLLAGEPVDKDRIGSGNHSRETAEQNYRLKREIDPADAGAETDGADSPPSPDKPRPAAPEVEKSAVPPGSRNTGQGEQTYPFVYFRIGEQAYALPLNSVVQVLRMAGLVRIPEAPPGIAGLLNLRGDIVPVVDLRERLGLASKNSHPDDRLILVRTGGRTQAIIADAVEKVLDVPDSSVESSLPSRQESRIVQAVIRGSDELILVLAADQIARVARRAALSGQCNQAM